MNSKQHNTLDALKSAYVFLTTNPIPTPLQNPSAGLNAQITTLKSAIDAADAEATSQVSGTLQLARGQRDALRDALRSQHLEPILRVAREAETTSPGLPKLVNMRSARSDQGLLNAVQAVLRDLPPYKDILIAKGLPADFLDELQSALTAYESASDTTRQTKTTRVQARAGLDTALQQGESCKRVIGAIIRRAVPTDPNGQTFLRGWESASHIRRGKSATPATTTGTTSEPSSSTTTTTSVPASTTQEHTASTSIASESAATHTTPTTTPAVTIPATSPASNEPTTATA